MRAVAALVATLCATSCIDNDFRIDQVSTEITVGGEELVVPLGELERTTLGDIVGDDEDAVAAAASEVVRLANTRHGEGFVAVSAEAELLILLSDIDGLYTADPHKDPDAKLIETVTALNEEILALAGGKGSDLGTGGMKTKLIAAGIATEAGCDMVITNGSRPTCLYDLAEGKAVGTRFVAKKG